MYKGKDIIGTSIVSYDRGEKYTTVQDLVFDQNSNQLLGFLVSEAGWFKSAQVLLLKDVQSIGPDALITSSETAIVRVNSIPALRRIIDHNNVLKGTRILTLDGRDLGTMVDLYFDEHTGDVEGYEVSGGLFADAYSGRSFVPAPDTLKIGRDVAFVPVQTAQLMEEQVGGIRAAMQTTSDKLQETAQITGDKLQEFGRSATTSVTNAIVDTETQKNFVIGKAVNDSITALGGKSVILRGQIVTPEIANSAEELGVLDELYRATGGSLTDVLASNLTETSNHLTDRVGNTAAGLTIDQAKGRRVAQVVRSPEGPIIAASGQIVTDHVIERAKAYHQEQALLEAAGLSVGDIVRDRSSHAMTIAGDRLTTTTRNTTEQLQAGARSLWAQVKGSTHTLQDRGSQAIEEKRIKGALGYAVTRVILDPDDQVILNVGELITHRSIVLARQAEVLDVLLNSVYHEKPILSLQDLRAPQPGKAAL
jgi:uncharacterized protein YrrD/cell division septum initiation protein DivIVA